MEKKDVILALQKALEAYIKQHDLDVYELGLDAGMESPPKECDCDLCKAARIAIAKAARV